MSEDDTKAADQATGVSGPDSTDRFQALLNEAQRFCAAVGLHESLILDIYRADSDWAFILQTEALIETAAKEIVRHSLKLQVLDRIIGSAALESFVDALPMNGRTSILKLLDAGGCPAEELGFVEALLRIRNAYAHDIRYMECPLIDLIKQRPDKSHLLKHLSAIETYDEQTLVEMYEKDGGFLRFGILDSAMRFLFFAYHLAARHRLQPQ